ncbi:MAG: nitrite reductase (NADH) small subunit [Kangiellaceae bacterium]|jgi:nitrite reductase (NADH) small subunit
MSVIVETKMAQKNTLWVNICAQSQLVENSGVCALLPPLETSGENETDTTQYTQIALFYMPSTHSLFVVSNWDPIGKANVIYRGIIGSIKDEPMVTSPLYKQHFSLVTGKCFEQADTSLLVYLSRIHDGKVQVSPMITVNVE